jgi:hypothetical protein
MSLFCELKAKWWLWGCLSIPPFAFYWLRPREIKGNTWSHWSYLRDYLHHTAYTINHDIWSFFLETLLWSVVVSLLCGLVAHYCVIVVWRAWKRRVAMGKCKKRQ